MRKYNGMHWRTYTKEDGLVDDGSHVILQPTEPFGFSQATASRRQSPGWLNPQAHPVAVAMVVLSAKSGALRNTRGDSACHQVRLDIPKMHALVGQCLSRNNGPIA